MVDSRTAAVGPGMTDETLSKDADKLIRRLSLVAYLLTHQGKPVRSEDVRQRVEGYALMTDDAFKRRFYEDRAELGLLGVEIRVEKADDGEFFSLPAANYYLPAIDLTQDELMALGACLLVLEESFAYSQPLRLALLSLAQGRPGLLQQQTPPIAVMPEQTAATTAGDLPKLQAAIAARKTVVFRYYSIGRDEELDRTVDPYGLLLVGDEWYMVGWCHTREALRTFRLSRFRSRVRHATKRAHDFRPPDDFSLSEYRDRPAWQLDGGGQTAAVRVGPDMAWWVEAHYSGVGELDHLDDGSVLFSTRVAAMRPFVAWAVGMGEAAEIVSPQAARDEAAAGLERLLSRLDEAVPAGAAGVPPRPNAASRRRKSGRSLPGSRHVDVDRFTRLTTLASYLLSRPCEGGALELPVAAVCTDLGITPADLRADVRLLNLVNFGGDGALLFGEFERDRLVVYGDLAGEALAPPARLSPLQADTLLLAVELVGGDLPSGSAPALGSAAAKIRAARGDDQCSVEATDALHVQDDVLALVNLAIREHRLLRIDYWSEGKGLARTRVVEPYVLLRQRGEWYYVCFCRTSQGVRVFRVATTRSAQLLDERFDPRDDVELDLYRSEGIKPTADYAPSSATLCYSPVVARWIMERQAATELPDGGCLAAQPYLDEVWLAHYVLRFLGEAVPLKPRPAVEAVRRAGGLLLERYRSPARP